MAKYKITYDRDDSGAWIAQVRGVPEAHSYGRTIEQARERVREALSLWRTNAASADFVDEVHLPPKARQLVMAFVQARERADTEQRAAQKSAQAAAAALTDRWNYSLRDAGELLGVSRQRVQQIKGTNVALKNKAVQLGLAAGRRNAAHRNRVGRRAPRAAARSGRAAKRRV
jgi:predicted RNase H-like HicB family nuclease